MLEVLLFGHGISGCDTTSSLYGQGKLKALKLLETSADLRKKVQIFGKHDATHNQIMTVGEDFIKQLYHSGKSPVKNLDQLRELLYKSQKYVSIERMPPTSRAVFYHLLRVHRQINTWKYLETKLPLERYGFFYENGVVSPVITDKAAAPPEILRGICCNCQSKDKLCASCGCKKRRIPCSIHCKCEGLCSNTSATEGSEND